MKNSDAFYRYAKALFSINASEDLDALLSGCASLLHDLPPFAAFLEHPQVALESKSRVLQTCIQDPLLVRFITLLIKRKRLKSLPAIASAYHQLRIASLGLMEAELVTATPLDAAITNRFKNRLEQSYHKTFTIKTTVDPRLIGGAMLFVGNVLVDYSLKGRLLALKNDLLRGLNATEA